jgi:hypothetical protein
MLAGLAKSGIFKIPPDFCANAPTLPRVVIRKTSAAAITVKLRLMYRSLPLSGSVYSRDITPRREKPAIRHAVADKALFPLVYGVSGRSRYVPLPFRV